MKIYMSRRVYGISKKLVFLMQKRNTNFKKNRKKEQTKGKTHNLCEFEQLFRQQQAGRG